MTKQEASEKAPEIQKYFEAVQKTLDDMGCQGCILATAIPYVDEGDGFISVGTSYGPARFGIAVAKDLLESVLNNE